MKTNNLIKYFGASVLLLASTSCIEETFPQDDYLTADQIAAQPDALNGYVNAITGMPVTSAIYSSSTTFDMGYPGFGYIRDIYCEDFPVYDASYDQFSYYDANIYLGEYSTSDIFWYLYYKYIGNCNNVLRTEETDVTRPFIGIARFYRALFYFDMARMYEYKDTGFSELDDAVVPASRGTTVPIVLENTTEQEARNLARASWPQMYSFLLSELDKAETCLTGRTRDSKKLPDVSVVNGLRARIWLDLATRFEQDGTALDKARQENVDFGVSDARAAFAKAADYAQSAITGSGAMPMTSAQWHNDGFVSLGNQSWMLGLSMNSEMLSPSSWWGWIAYIAPETLYGLAGLSDATGSYENIYAGQRMISTALYNTIPDTDWRKTTWIDPADAGNPEAASKYVVYADPTFFKMLPAYTGFKFRPRSGAMVDYTTGSAVDYPLMRVEEMYLIRAEALAASQGVGAGASALSDFVNSYRMSGGTYTCPASSLEAFRTELMRQKRIEFWGEGLIAWDYKRLNLQVVKGYSGTNYPASHRVNSKEGYCAPWLNTYVMRSQMGMNAALTGNPDPSIVNCLWSE